MSGDTLSDLLRAVRLHGAVFYYIEGAAALGGGGPARARDHSRHHARRGAHDRVPRDREGLVLGRDRRGSRRSAWRRAT